MDAQSLSAIFVPPKFSLAEELLETGKQPLTAWGR